MVAKLVEKCQVKVHPLIKNSPTLKLIQAVTKFKSVNMNNKGNN